MKKIVAALILFASIMQTFGQGLVIVEFYGNRDYISQKLCINKNKPELKCCGICQLKKKLHEEDKNDRGNPLRRFEGKFESGFYLIYMEEYLFLGHDPARPRCNLKFYFPSEYPTRFFHPPAVLG